MDWQALMGRLMAGLEPLVLALLSAAIVYVIGWLKAHTSATNLSTNQTKTALAVAATNQTMPGASGDKKLGATLETLGAGADRTLIEAEVLMQKPAATCAPGGEVK